MEYPKNIGANLSPRLAELISDGSLEDLYSTALCSTLGEDFGGTKAVVIRSHDGNPTAVHSSGVDQSSVAAYEEYFFRLDPMSHCRSSNSVIRMSDTVPRKSFESSEFYNDFFKPMGSYHSLSLMRKIGGKETLELAISREKKSADFQSSDKVLLKSVAAVLTARIGVMEAGIGIEPDYRQDKLDKLQTLSERELEVFLHISAGNSLLEFKQKNQISIHTARTLLKSVRNKLGVGSQLELVKIARVIS